MITCKFESGDDASLRHISTGVLVINDQNQILLTKRASHLLRGDKYTIPGGYLDRGETLEEGALRELKEETGYEGEILQLFHINSSPKRPHEDRQNVDVIYLARITGGTVQKDKETTEVGWYKKEELPPDSEFAFDHRTTILKYYQYLEKPFRLPIIDEVVI